MEILYFSKSSYVDFRKEKLIDSLYYKFFGIFLSKIAITERKRDVY
jgi:hypothetical protein